MMTNSSRTSRRSTNPTSMRGSKSLGRATPSVSWNNWIGPGPGVMDLRRYHLGSTAYPCAFVHRHNSFTIGFKSQTVMNSEAMKWAFRALTGRKIATNR